MRILRKLLGTAPGWKSFAFEVAIVVLGVAIAMLADDFVSNFNRRAEIRQSMKAVEDDLLVVMLFASERLAVEPCRLEQENDLKAQLSEFGTQWDPDVPESINRDADFLALDLMIRSPQRQMPDSAWRAFMASSSALYLDVETYSTIDSIFGSVEKLNSASEDIWQLQGRISHLSVPGRLSDAERRNSLALLGELSALQSMRYVLSEQLLTLVTDNVVFDADYWGSFDEAAQRPYISGVSGLVAAGQAVYGECFNAKPLQLVLDELNGLWGTSAHISNLPGGDLS